MQSLRTRAVTVIAAVVAVAEILASALTLARTIMIMTIANAANLVDAMNTANMTIITALRQAQRPWRIPGLSLKRIV